MLRRGGTAVPDLSRCGLSKSMASSLTITSLIAVCCPMVPQYHIHLFPSRPIPPFAPSRLIGARNKFLVKSVPDFINLTLECCPFLSKESQSDCSRALKSFVDLIYLQGGRFSSFSISSHSCVGMSLMLEVDDSEEKLKVLVLPVSEGRQSF